MTLTLAAGLAFGPVAAVAQSGAADRVEAAAVGDAPTAKATSGGIELVAPADTKCHFTIYSITGQIIKSTDVTGRTVVEIQRGCYIIKCGSWLRKVVVR